MDTQGKVWGHTSLLFEKNNVEIHRLECFSGKFCSKHKHEHKYNQFLVESGSIKIEVWKKDYDLVDTTILTAGQSTTVKPGEFHRFTCIDDAVVFEIYWVALLGSDIVRETVGGDSRLSK
jgi:mannose-6-phosphate isomerase-like protein (cupin superfamily)